MIKSHKYVKTETLDNLISKYSTLVYDTESKLYGSLNAEKNIFDKFGAIRTVIASYGPVGFFVNLGLDFANDLFNISQKSEYAVYTYGAATMADCFSEYLKNQLYQSFIIGEDYYEVYNNDISKRYFVYLAKLRLYSEDRYCKFRNLYNIEDYSNELLIANYNISFLQDYLSRDYIWW